MYLEANRVVDFSSESGGATPTMRTREGLVARFCTALRHARLHNRIAFTATTIDLSSPSPPSSSLNTIGRHPKQRLFP